MDLSAMLADLAAARPVAYVQAVDTLFAMVVVLAFMHLGGKLLTYTFMNLSRFRMAKERDLRDVFAGKKGDLGDPEGEFREFCEKFLDGAEDFGTWRSWKVKQIAVADKKTVQQAADKLLKDEHAIDAYLDEDDTNRESFSRFACYRGANAMMLYLQHGIAGLFGVYALCQAGDEDFVLYARWGMLFEAGWELSDWLFFIIPSIAKGRGAQAIPMIIHHMCLYGLLPVNLYVVQGPLGRYIAWALVTMAGSIGPTSVLMLFKDVLDDKNTIEKWAGRAILVSVVIILLTVRGPVWWWLGYNLVVKSKPLGLAVHALFIVLAILFQLFNFIFYAMAFMIVKDMVAPANEVEEDRAKRAFEIALGTLCSDPYSVGAQNKAQDRAPATQEAEEPAPVATEPERPAGGLKRRAPRTQTLAMAAKIRFEFEERASS